MASKKRSTPKVKKKKGYTSIRQKKSHLKEEIADYSPKEGQYPSMTEVLDKDHKCFLKKHKTITIGDTVLSLGCGKKITHYEPENFELECTSVWSFPKRGDWATHKGDYRGNWAPEIPRNILLRYSQPGDLVLDQMMGGGTTLIECKLLGRNSIGLDVNPSAVMLTRDRLGFEYSPNTKANGVYSKTYTGDARNLDGIASDSVDLIATHPPYANIISYSKDQIPNDLSRIKNIKEFAEEMQKVADEAYRVLKPGKYCAILIGDTRKHKHYIPITSRVMQSFLDVGFVLKEDIIKQQWQCKTTPFWAQRSKSANFLLIMHEHLYVFRKPDSGENIEKLRY